MKNTRTRAAIVAMTVVALGLPMVRAAEEGMLSEAELKSLVTQYTKEETKSVFKMSVSAARQSFNTRTEAGKRQLESYKESGKIPYRITAYLAETPEGQRRGKMIKGDARVYMLDAAGNTILNEDVSLDKLCPSWGGRGGYSGEVAKAGKYKVVVYIKREGVIFGKEMEVDLQPYK